jgi:hypothetical protein
MVHQLLWADAVRGYDSTGIVVATGDKINYFKRGLPSPDFLRTIAYERLIKPQLEKSRVIIGHNRASTKTAVSDENAHPFASHNGKIILVHNGFIQNANQLLTGNQYVVVDSAAIPLVMEDKGEKEALELLRGAFSLAWYNKEDQTLNLARNKERELFVGYVKNKNQLVFGSEWMMLHWILGRHGLQVDEWKEVAVGEMLKFKASNPRGEVSRTVFQLPPNTPVIRGSGGHSITGQGSNTTTNSLSAAHGKGIDHLSVSRRVEIFLEQVAHLNKTERVRTGIPTSKKKLEQLAGRLSEFGYRLGETIGIGFNGFSLYKNQRNLGVGFGTRRSNPNVHIKMPGITDAEFDEYQGMEAFYGLLVGMDISGTQKRLILICIPIGNQYDPDPIPQEVKDTESVTLSNGDKLSYDRFVQVIGNGCAWCNGNLHPYNAKDFVWTDNQTCLCEICADDEEVISMFNLNGLVQSRATITGKEV